MYTAMRPASKSVPATSWRKLGVFARQRRTSSNYFSPDCRTAARARNLESLALSRTQSYTLAIKMVLSFQGPSIAVLYLLELLVARLQARDGCASAGLELLVSIKARLRLLVQLLQVADFLCGGPFQAARTGFCNVLYEHAELRPPVSLHKQGPTL